MKTECPICLLPNGKTTLKCNHTFHKKCIQKWQEKSNTCPMCREKITLTSARAKNTIKSLIETEKLKETRRNIILKEMTTKYPFKKQEKQNPPQGFTKRELKTRGETKFLSIDEFNRILPAAAKNPSMRAGHTFRGAK